MLEYEFSLTRIFLYKDKILDSILIPGNYGPEKSLFWHILRNKVGDD